MSFLTDEKQHSTSESNDQQHPHRPRICQLRCPPRRTVCNCLSSFHYRTVRRIVLYCPLLHEDSIRLLYIQPGQRFDKLHCRLRHVRLSHNLPTYEALSYVWGSKMGEHIICNEHHRVSVTQNLFYALQELRQPDRMRALWVDALCINQSNNWEKRSQVRKMGLIYESAERVVVWLGRDGSGEAKRAFEIVEEIAEKSDTGSEDGSLELSTVSTISSSPSLSPSSLETNVTTTSTTNLTALPIPLSHPDWSAVQSLFAREWFIRLWVIQEIVLARSATFHWGSHSIPWSVLGAAVNMIRSNVQLTTLLESRNLQNAYFMHYIQTKGVEEMGSNHPFLHLLDWGRNFDVTDLKDKVYALLGLVMGTTGQEENRTKGKCWTTCSRRKGSTPTPFIEPNYNCSTAKIYTETARKILTQDTNLDILSFVMHDPSNNLGIDEALPTWVPDWASQNTVFPISGLGTENRYAAGTFRSLDLATLIPRNNDKALFLSGIRVDVVKNVLSCMPYTTLKDSTPHLEALVTNVLTSFSASQSLASIATTLSAGRTSQGWLLSDPEQHLADFIALVHSLCPSLLESTYPTLSPSLEANARDNGSADRAKEAIWRFNCCRSVFETEGGGMGLGSAAVEKGDVVVVLWGGQGVYVLRRAKGERDGGRRWRFVGECFVEGLMGGEAGEMADGREERFEVR